jgi:hypothetical protein
VTQRFDSPLAIARTTIMTMQSNSMLALCLRQLLAVSRRCAMPVSRIRIAIVLAFTTWSLLLYGCGREIAASELSGVWKVTPESRERLPQEFQARLGSLALEPSGVFKARGIPGEIFGQPGRLVSGSGRWTFLQGERLLRLSLRELSDGNRARLPYGTHIDVRTDGGGLTLRYYIGDPDSMNTIEFSK